VLYYPVFIPIRNISLEPNKNYIIEDTLIDIFFLVDFFHSFISNIRQDLKRALGRQRRIFKLIVKNVIE